MSLLFFPFAAPTHAHLKSILREVPRRSFYSGYQDAIWGVLLVPSVGVYILFPGNKLSMRQTYERSLDRELISALAENTVLFFSYPLPPHSFLDGMHLDILPRTSPLSMVRSEWWAGRETTMGKISSKLSILFFFRKFLHFFKINRYRYI